MSSFLTWETKSNSFDETRTEPSQLDLHNLRSLREAAITLLREVESLSKARPPRQNHTLRLQDEVQRYEVELIREALQRTRGNQRRAAKLLGVKVTTLNCKIKRFGISFSEDEPDFSICV